jgi:hypothetical protein
MGVLVITTVVGWMPLLLLLLSIGIASTLGCQLTEATVHPCSVAGINLGPAAQHRFYRRIAAPRRLAGHADHPGRLDCVARTHVA